MRLLRWATVPALLTVVVGAGLEVEGLVRAQRARASLRPAVEELLSRAPDAASRVQVERIRYSMLSGFDASTASELEALATRSPSPEAWAATALAYTWSRAESLAARAARAAERLAPGDARFTALMEDALDAATLEEVREVTRPFLALGGIILFLASLGWLRRRALARRREAWLARAQVRVVGSADGRTASPGEDLLVPRNAQSVSLDVFLSAPPAPRSCGRHGPTLSVVLSHGQESRALRLTPVKDVREDAVRVRLSAATLMEVAARAGRWRVTVALDGRPVAETGLLVPAASPQPVPVR
jgi:hypothetical protein